MSQPRIELIIKIIEDNELFDLPEMLYVESKNELNNNYEDAEYNSDVIAFLAYRVQDNINTEFKPDKNKLLKIIDEYDSEHEKLNKYVSEFDTSLMSIRTFFYWFNQNIYLQSTSQRNPFLKKYNANKLQEILNNIEDILKNEPTNEDELSSFQDIMIQQIEDLSKFRYEPHVSDKEIIKAEWKVKRGKFYEFSIKFEESKSIVTMINSLSVTYRNIQVSYSKLDSIPYNELSLQYTKTQSELKQTMICFILKHMK